ncbi:MAG: hypothetical protein IKE30_05855 [Clostridia bacterium]|nr:hypothetical protein [Clostridia bacterium]
MAKDVSKIFHQMVNDMYALEPSDDILEACMSLNESAIRRIPLRCRIIALGFVRRFSLEELNGKLAQYGCPRLYSRNFWEATLIFAFLHGNSYEEWRQMQAQVRDLYSRAEDSQWFRSSKITYAELERYVSENSDTQGDMLVTQRQTRYLEDALASIPDGIEALRAFLSANLRSFSTVRERTRYYFCKYLYYYLNQRIENYLNAWRRCRGVGDALSEMSVLKVVTKLRRNEKAAGKAERTEPGTGPAGKSTATEEDKRSLIRDSAISCGEVFDAFNYFYFGYVSTDWIEILTECYESLEDIPARQKRGMAEVLRKNHPGWEGFDDSRVIRESVRESEEKEDAAYSSDGSRGYGKNRAGEHAVYKYIQGSLDIDRTVLICFLLFFAGGTQMPQDQKLTVQRMNDILTRCGYAALDIEQDFDWFAEEFLESDRPLDFLDEVIVGYARQQENSFLYRIYGGSVQYEEELRNVMIPKKA